MKRFLKTILLSFVFFVGSCSFIFARDRIHVITVERGAADAIILESNGHFAMIDTGEDKDYPKGNNPKYPFRDGITTNEKNSTEDRLFSHLNKIGVKSLDFIIGTHVHSDHISTVDEVVRKIPTKRLYLKKYSDKRITDESRLWDNQYVYDNAIKSARENGTELIQDITKELSNFQFGNINIQLLNYENEYDSNGELKKVWDDNMNSILSVINVNGQRLFFGGDLDNTDGREDRYAEIIGKVDFMKMNHHGFIVPPSNTKNFVRVLSPKQVLKTMSYDLEEDYENWLKNMGISVIDASRIDQEAIVLDIDENGVHDISKNFRRYGLIEENGILLFKKWNGLFVNGWIKNDYKWYYGENNKLFINKWKESYYLKSNAEMARSEWIYDDDYKAWYYLEESGAYKYNKWQGSYYLKSDGKMASSEWIYDDDYRAWYYLEKSGAYKYSKWQESYYLKSNGKMASSEWIYDDDYKAWYYLNQDGSFAKNTVTPDGYRVDETGKFVN